MIVNEISLIIQNIKLKEEKHQDELQDVQTSDFDHIIGALWLIPWQQSLGSIRDEDSKG